MAVGTEACRFYHKLIQCTAHNIKTGGAYVFKVVANFRVQVIC